MKKKLISLALVCAMVFALGATALADTTEVKYTVDPTYTVSIPAAVTLTDAEQTQNITASNVILAQRQKITVKLTAASNTTSGSTFNAKNGTSVATYTITKDSTQIALNDTVAEFTANGAQALTFSAANTTGIKVAGDHTETLTFTIATEDVPPTLADALVSGATIMLGFDYNGQPCTNTFTNNNGTFTLTDSTGSITGTMEIVDLDIEFKINGGTANAGGVFVTLYTYSNLYWRDANSCSFTLTNITVDGIDITANVHPD